MHKIFPFVIIPILSLVFSPLMLTFSFYTYLFAGNIETLHAAKQIGVKLGAAVFGKGGLSGDVNAAEEMIKECIPEDMKMCDVTYPRY